MPHPVSAGIIQHHEAFWNGTNKDALLSISSVSADFHDSARKKGLVKPWMEGTWWYFAKATEMAHSTGDFTCVEDALKLYAHQYEMTTYAGVGYPMFFANLGAGALAALLTGYSYLDDNTVWFELDKAWPYEKILSLDSFHPYADTVFKVMEMTAEHLRGRAVVSNIDMGGLADVLSSMRRCDGILYDFYDYPAEVIQALDLLLKFWFKAHDTIDALLRTSNGNLYTHWVGNLSTRPFYPHQCDVCALVGPEQFREFILPSLAAEMARFPATVYHLDGSHEIVHLDALCESPTLRAIQWVPEPGVPFYDERYYPLYKRIIELGRKIIFSGWPGSCDSLRGLFKMFPREAFFITVGGKDIAEHAEFLRVAEGR